MADKRKPINFTALATPLVFIAVLVLIQLVSHRFTMRADLTDKRLFSLSEKTVNVLSSLDGSDLTATAFLTANDYDRQATKDLLDEYRSKYSHFSYEIIDPANNPNMVEKFGVSSNGTIVLEYKGKTRKVVSGEEEAVTNGINRLIDDHSPVVYFITGHGEKSISGEYSQLADALSSERYDVKELLLVRENGVPADAEALVIAGQKTPLTDPEVKAVEDYLKKGGSLMLLIEPMRRSGLDAYLEDLGLTMELDTIIDEQSQMMGGDVLLPIVNDYGTHVISRGLGMITLYPVCRSVEIADNLPSGVEAWFIGRTSQGTWAERDLEGLSSGEIGYTPGVDLQGPVNTGVALTVDNGDSSGDSRIVVYGDADFTGNDYFEVAGNKDLAMNSVAWLTSEQSLIGIRSRDPNHTPVILTSNESTLVFWLSIVLLPLLSALAGLAVMVINRWRR